MKLDRQGIYSCAVIPNPGLFLVNQPTHNKLKTDNAELVIF